MAEEKKLSGPDFAEGVSISEFGDGGMVQGHANGEAILVARRCLLRHRRVLYPLWRSIGLAIRPRPEQTFDDRIYAVASSEDSIESAARLNAAIVMFADRAWEARLPAVEKHRQRTRELHGVNGH